MNAPDRMDAIRVPADMPKIALIPDEKVPNAATFRVAREDHTMGNLLRMELLRDPKVKFAGYKHPHPLDNDILIRIQAAASTNPVSALGDAAKRLEDEFRHILGAFEREAMARTKSADVL